MHYIYCSKQLRYYTPQKKSMVKLILVYWFLSSVLLSAEHHFSLCKHSCNHSLQFWYHYADGRLCAKAFDLEQFELAKKYGKNCTDISPLKRLCSQHEWMFKLFLTFRTIKRKLKK